MSKDARKRGAKKSGRKNPVNRTAELARKRERRSLRLRFYAFGGLVLALVLFGFYHFWLRDSALFSINELHVTGISEKSKEGRQIEQAVRDAMGEMTTLHADQGKLDQELSRFPRVAASRIETTLPDKATVTVVLRENGSIFGDGSDALLVATDGMVLGAAAGQEGKLPLISEGDPLPGEDEPDGSDPDVQPVLGAGSMLTGRTLNQALILGAAPDELRAFIDRSAISPEGVEVRFRNGPAMLFGDTSQLDQKWRAAAAVIADPNFETASYVDLTVPRRPGVEPENPIEELPEEAVADPSGELYAE